MAVSKRLRYEVLRRDNHACRYCGGISPDVKLTVDHVTPTTLGGTDDPSNLVSACVDCNSGKSASSPDAVIVADVDERAVRWALAMTTAIEQRALELAAERSRTDSFNAVWSMWTIAGDHVPRSLDWKSSVLRFLAGGLDDQFLTDAVTTAMSLERLPTTEKWRYFCGICWRELDKLRALTIQFLESNSVAPDTHHLVQDFPFMEFVDWLLREIVVQLGGNGDAERLADSALWNGMPVTHHVYEQQIKSGADEGTAHRLAQVELENVTAYYLHHIGLTRVVST